MTDMNPWVYDVQQPVAPDVSDGSALAEAPSYSDVLPDGTPTEVTGNPQGDAQFNHQQGDNPYGYQNDCGLVSAQDILNQFGVNVSEGDVVQHAVQNGECDVSNDPTQAGGTSLEQEAQILTDYGVPAHTEQETSLDELANHVQNDQGVIIGVNAGVLWHDSNSYDQGQANHAIVVTGVARDPQTGQIRGFYVNDSGDGQSAKFVDANTMQQAWLAAGGGSVVTDNSHS
jgi:hypothetical protein